MSQISLAFTEILSRERVAVADASASPKNKADVLRRLAALLANAQDRVTPDRVFEVLSAREQQQSTGFGGGVALPHGRLEELDRQLAALLVCAKPVDFEAIDGEPVSIFFGLLDPKAASGLHLKTLARVSRLLRPLSFRQRLVAAPDAASAYAIIHGIAPAAQTPARSVAGEGG